MPLGRRQFRRQAARLALAITAVCAPVVAVMAGSWTGLAAPLQVTAYGGTCAGGGYAVAWTNGDQTVTPGTAITFANCKTSLSMPGNHGLSASWTNKCNPASTDWERTAAQSTVCTFSSPGTYSYVCSNHGASMAGAITVTGAPPPPPMKPPPPPPPPPTHPAMSPRSQPPAAVAAPPTPSPSPVPSPSPSDTSQALAAPSDSSTARSGSVGLASSPTGSSGGFPTGLLILGLVVLLGCAGAAVYFVGIRKLDTPGS